MIIKQIFVYIFSNFFQQFLGIFTSFSTRRFILPGDFGVWVTINMVMDYCSYSNLGIFSALHKEIPYYIGKKDYKTADDIKNLSGTFIVFAGFIVSVIIFVLSFLPHINTSLSIGLKLISAMLFLTLIFNFFITLLRAHSEFISLSRIILINSIVIFLLYIPLSFFWHLYGLYVAALLSLCITIVYTAISNRNIVKFHFISSFRKFKHIFFLLKIGVSLLILGFLYIILVTTERWTIVNRLGFSQMGYYSIAIMFFDAISRASLLVSHITFTKVQNLYGEMGETKEFSVSIRKYLPDLTLYTAYITPVALGLTYIWGNFLVARFIPKYIPGIASMNILVIGALFMGLSHFSNHFLQTVNKYLLSIPIYVIATLVILLSSLFLIYKGLGIEGAAIAASIGYFLFFMGSSWLALKNIYTLSEILKFYMSIFIVLAYYGVVIFICTRVKFNNIFITMPAQTLLLLIGTAPVFIKFNKETGLISKLLQIKGAA